MDHFIIRLARFEVKGSVLFLTLNRANKMAFEYPNTSWSSIVPFDQFNSAWFPHSIMNNEGQGQSENYLNDGQFQFNISQQYGMSSGSTDNGQQNGFSDSRAYINQQNGYPQPYPETNQNVGQPLNNNYPGLENPMTTAGIHPAIDGLIAAPFSQLNVDPDIGGFSNEFVMKEDSGIPVAIPVMKRGRRKGPNGEKLRIDRCKCPNCLSGYNKIPGVKKVHVCHMPNCYKQYCTTSHLKAHILTHEGIRPFACKEPGCGKNFTRSDELARHIRTHTGARNYICQICSKKFIRSDHLSKHVKSHSAVRKIRKPRGKAAPKENEGFLQSLDMIDFALQENELNQYFF